VKVYSVEEILRSNEEKKLNDYLNDLDRQRDEEREKEEATEGDEDDEGQ